MRRDISSNASERLTPATRSSERVIERVHMGRTKMITAAKLSRIFNVHKDWSCYKFDEGYYTRYQFSRAGKCRVFLIRHI